MRLDKNILLLIMVTAAFMFLLFLINQEERPIIFEPQTPVKETPPMIEPSTSNYTLMVPEDVCEGCHMSGKSSVPQALTIEPHQNGGQYCLTCHVISHEKHPMNDNVTCEKCHSTATKPVYENGFISCNNCHNYPDPLQPSQGNLITIHRQRGISCNTCHTDSCTRCHSEAGTSERWIKRIEHFKVVAK